MTTSDREHVLDSKRSTPFPLLPSPFQLPVPRLLNLQFFPTAVRKHASTSLYFPQRRMQTQACQNSILSAYRVIHMSIDRHILSLSPCFWADI